MNEKDLYKIRVEVSPDFNYYFDKITSFFVRSRKHEIKNPKKILFLRNDHIGDMVYSTQVFREVKKSFPNAEIGVVATASNREIIEKDPNVDKIFEIDLFFSRGRISILNSGETVREYRVLPHRIFRTIHTFQTSRSYKTSLFQSQYHMADTAYKYLLGKAELPINIDEAVENIGICEKITHMDFYK